MLLNSNLELSKDEIELLYQSNSILASSYETIHDVLNITNQIIDKNRWIDGSCFFVLQ